MKRLLFTLLCCACAGLLQAQVMMNEFLYDTQSTDDPNIMYVEIYGPAGTDLGEWSLVGTNGNGGAVYLTVTLTGSIPSDGYYVVGGANVANVDQIATADFQNAGGTDGDDCDGIDLRNHQGQLMDHLCYGTCEAGHVCNGEGGSNAPDPFPSQGVNRALARVPDHSDTDNNGTDWVITDQLTPGMPNSGEPCEPLTVSLAQVRQNNASGVPALLGQFVVFTAVVNVDNYVLDSLTLSNFYCQDEDAGVNIFRGVVPAGIIPGAEITVSGWVGQFNGLTEILSSGQGNCVFDVEINGNGSPPTPAVLQCNALFESYESMLATIQAVTIVDGDWPSQGENGNLTITDGTGTLTLRIDKDSQVDGTPEPQGAFDVTGIITQFDFESPYDGFYQITARYPSDIQPLAADDRNPNGISEDFRLTSVYPNPFNSSARIAFEVGSARELQLTIFNTEGRVVLSERLSGLTPGAHQFTWSPSGASGLYLASLRSESSVQSTKLLYLK